jgi:hypothetical protein
LRLLKKFVKKLKQALRNGTWYGTGRYGCRDMPGVCVAFAQRYLQGAYLANSAKARYSVSSGDGTTPATGVGQVGLMAGIRHLF